MPRLVFIEDNSSGKFVDYFFHEGISLCPTENSVTRLTDFVSAQELAIGEIEPIGSLCSQHVLF